MCQDSCFQFVLTNWRWFTRYDFWSFMRFVVGPSSYGVYVRLVKTHVHSSWRPHRRTAISLSLRLADNRVSGPEPTDRPPWSYVYGRWTQTATREVNIRWLSLLEVETSSMMKNILEAGQCRSNLVLDNRPFLTSHWSMLWNNFRRSFPLKNSFSSQEEHCQSKSYEKSTEEDK